MKIKKIVFDENRDIRLDLFLHKHFPDKSRSHIQKLIGDGSVLVNNTARKNNYNLKFQDEIVINIKKPVNSGIDPEDIPLDILYEDRDVIVVNKPQGMIVHPAPSIQNGTLVNALLAHCTDLSGINGITRPGIVHRIDKDTSGILVVAKNDFAHNKLAEQLKNHSMTREYTALVEGVLKQDSGTIDEPIARHPRDKIKMAVVQGGKRAVTNYKVIERFKNNTLVKCILETGRTHQIRVHMAYIGHPLVGDPVYGYKKQKFNLNGQLLHAEKLGFIHPSTEKYIEFETDLPVYFKKIIDIMKNNR
ncbi:RluA family pseudouridine synthase [Clostridium tyrobutyricum]|uniref:RluA family pseudouridine synthase n=1 Tax=Clostridium tyrobutyricum TaxID=1519 RepID=UPI001C38D643|nr:RluA family pseudouridine synthase [Clostridium tyrobutyricum]MBV4419095.1 RluA family pseudouridine synthase [Clostridium tyrobutyricum]